MASNSSQPCLELKRSVSLNDLDAALWVREMIEKDVVLPEDATKHRHFQSLTRLSFALPSMQFFPPGLYQLVFSKLIDEHIMKELQATRRLNWCGSVAPMVTLMTLGDGNCLMHAASLAMWAVSDRYHILRKTVYDALLEDVQGMCHFSWFLSNPFDAVFSVKLQHETDLSFQGKKKKMKIAALITKLMDIIHRNIILDFAEVKVHVLLFLLS